MVMRATVDSKELAAAVSAASKYSKVSSSGITSSMLFVVGDGWLTIRTTTFTENCRVRVNLYPADDPNEDGYAIVPTSRITALAMDSGGRVTLRTTPSQLRLDYDNMKVGLQLNDIAVEDWPTWRDAKVVISVPTNVLRAVCATTDKPDASGRPVTTAVHIVKSGDGEVAVMSSMGGESTMVKRPGNIDERLAIRSDMLRGALSLFGNTMINIGTDGGSISLSADNSPIVVSFPSIDTPDPTTWITNLFGIETQPGITIKRTQLLEIISRCKVAHSIDEKSQVLFSGSLNVNIAGDGIEMQDIHFDVTGSLGQEMAFFCKAVTSITDMLESDEYTISAVKLPADEYPRFIYVNGQGRSVIPRMIGGYFQMQ